MRLEDAPQVADVSPIALDSWIKRPVLCAHMSVAHSCQHCSAGESTSGCILLMAVSNPFNMAHIALSAPVQLS